MKKPSYVKEMQKRLQTGAEFIVPFSQALSHRHRYEILVSLLDGPHSFKFVESRVEIARTATANHLSHLLDTELVEKPERGVYKITSKGRSFLETLLDFYNKQKVKELNKARELQNHYKQAFNTAVNSKNYIIPHPAAFDPSWVSFLGCFSGVLQSMGGPWDIVDLAGFSGYSFLINVAKNKLCPSGPTVFRASIWRKMVRSLENLGFQVESYFDEKTYPQGDELSTEDKRRALKFRNWVINQLKKTQNPVIVWGVPIPEFAVINGVKGKNYVCSTFRSSVGAHEDPVHFEQLQAPGGLLGYAITDPIREKWKRYGCRRDYESIQQAVSFTKHFKAVNGYVLGIEAYEEWARNLEYLAESESDYHGNSYVGECLLEQKTNTIVFISRLLKRHSNTKWRNSIQKAIEEYSHVVDLLKKFQKIFPFSLKGTFSDINRKKGAAILRSILPYEESAIDFLEATLNNRQIKPQ